MQEKVCNHCRKSKPLSDFYFKAGAYRGECKKCSNKISTACHNRKRSTDPMWRMRDRAIKLKSACKHRLRKRATTSRYWYQNKARMTDAWVRGNIRKNFGSRIVITPKIMIATRKRIQTVRSKRLLQLFSMGAVL